MHPRRPTRERRREGRSSSWSAASSPSRRGSLPTIAREPGPLLPRSGTAAVRDGLARTGPRGGGGRGPGPAGPHPASAWRRGGRPTRRRDRDGARYQPHARPRRGPRGEGRGGRGEARGRQARGRDRRGPGHQPGGRDARRGDRAPARGAGRGPPPAGRPQAEPGGGGRGRSRSGRSR